MSTCLLFLVIAISPLVGATQARCEPRAVSLPFEGQRLSNQADARGFLLGIGTSRQNVSVVLCASHADTYVYDENASCANETSQACMTSRGGFYDRSSSASRKPGFPINHILDGPDANWTKEFITLSDSSLLQDFEFGVSNKPIHPWRSQAELGIGMNSSFIDALHAAGNISSKSYSFSWGNDFADQSYDGSMTFGGYDRSVLAGVRNVTKTFTRSEPSRCPEGMIVELTEMNLASESGDMANIFEGLGAIKVCIVPSMRNIMALDKTYGDRIIKGLGGIRADGGINGMLGGMLSPTVAITTESATFRGNLSITLENTVTIDFTSFQLLFKGDPYLDSAGMVHRNSPVTNIPIVIMYAGDPNMPRLGGMFFNPAYLMVNHDKNEFSIAPAQTPPAQPDIVGIDTAHDCLALLNGTVLLSTSSTPEEDVSTPDSDRLTSGTITGISIGAVAGIVFIILVSFLFWRRRRGTF